MLKPDLDLLARARELVADVTPLTGDCGLLCQKRCCTGEETQLLGMILFPGEKELMEGISGYTFSPTGWLFDGSPATLAQCTGPCDRRTRPLACRLFPLAFYLDEKKHLKLILEPLAKPVCPLCASGLSGLRSDFRHAAAACARLLVQDPVQKAFIEALSRQTDAVRRDPFYRLGR